MSIAPNMILFGTWMETTALSTPESLMMIGNIMISCRIALLLSHRCRDMRFLAYFNPVPDTYADAVEKAGGFAFLAQLSQEKSPF